MIFKVFPKHSPGWQIYGWGFIFNLFKYNLIIGTKKSKYWSSKKNYKDFAKKTWRSKKKFVS
tara:strand:+ start:213 stop:398 length:186 start_codon:yes stop_codon:yes gene_type:complete